MNRNTGKIREGPYSKLPCLRPLHHHGTDVYHQPECSPEHRAEFLLALYFLGMIDGIIGEVSGVHLQPHYFHQRSG